MALTLQQAQKGLEAGIKKAKELNSASSISILDEGRNLLAYARMDGALLASIDLSRAKAFTAASMKMKTGDLAPLVQPGGILYGLESAHTPPLVVFGGGAPIAIAGNVVGAVGVAGGMVPDDEAVADAVAAAISEQ